MKHSAEPNSVGTMMQPQSTQNATSTVFVIETDQETALASVGDNSDEAKV